MTNHKPVVFIVDDESAVRDSLTLMIEQADISVQSFESADAFLSAYGPDFFGCIILDVQMPEMDACSFRPNCFIVRYGYLSSFLPDMAISP